MATPSSGPDLFNDLAHEFTERYRRGERPSLEEYTERYPELADEIRQLFPALVMMEELGSGVASPSTQITSMTLRPAPIPERLGDYRILREIGRGGMGIVYEAIQESLGRHVALKVLPSGHQIGPVQLKRFEREAKAAALLHHTNIVPVFGVGEHEGVHYYAMQYIEGQSLDAVLREVIRQRREAVRAKSASGEAPESLAASLATDLTSGRLSVSQVRTGKSHADAKTEGGAAHPEPSLLRAADGSALEDAGSSSSSIRARTAAPYYRGVARAGMQAAEALDYAHAHGVLHRDIKPANLLLDLQGTIWITDFGLAKAEGSGELTSPGDVVGTLRFMAPERFRGKADARSDVYSLGATLYEMLTLKPVFAVSERASLISAILLHDPIRPRKHEQQIPRDLETIVLKAIARNPADRFVTAGEMARELGRFVAGRPIYSRRASVPERLWRWSRRNPAVALLSLLAATLTTALAIGSSAAAWKFREQRDSVRVEQENTQAALGHSLLLQARALRYARQPGRRARALQTLADAAKIARAQTAPPGHLEQLRDELIATLGEVDEGPVRKWTGLIRFSETLASFALDVDRYAFVVGGDSLHVRRFSDQSEIRVVKSKRGFEGRPMLIAGGRFAIVWSGSTQTELWDLERGEMAAEWPADVRCASPRADGAQVAAIRSGGEVRVYDLPSMSEAARFPLGADVPRRYGLDRMALSPDGRYLAFLRADKQTAWVHEVASGRLVLDLKTPKARVYSALALSRNGGLIAITHDRAISVFDVVDGGLLSVLQGHQSEGITAHFEPASDLLASQSWDGTTRVWDPIRGRLLVTLPGLLQSWVGTDSTLAIIHGEDLILYKITAAEERRTIDCRMLSDRAGTALFGPASLAYSPDGQMIAMALRPEGVRIVRASDGAGLAQLPIGDCDALVYQPDGSLLTWNDLGLCRWPVRPLERGHLRIGPPEPIAPIFRRLGHNPAGLASSASGRLVAVDSPGHFGSLLLDPDRPWRRSWLIPYHEVNDVAISPDGQWAATACWEGSPDDGKVQVWNVATGQLRVALPLGNSVLEFSPDSQWFGVGSLSRCQFFKTGSWTLGTQIDHGTRAGYMRTVFHPRSRIVAISDATRSVPRLVDVQTGRVLGALETTSESLIHCLAFSPDGRYLAASHTDQRVDLWDLSLIRRGLEDLNLSVGLPVSLGATRLGADSPTVDSMEVVGADATGLRLLAVRQTLREFGFALRGLTDGGLADAEELRVRGVRWQRLGSWQLAAADFRASLARQPSSDFAANELAWTLASRPDRGNVEEALRWAKKAVELVPGNTDYRNTLGAALYRAGRLAEAAIELERGIAARPPMAGYDWVFLAMCRQRLGLAAQARLALDEASRWSRENSRAFPVQVAAFQPLLQEAQAVVDGTLPELPSEVFVR
jgi:serine/threonine protein kinase/WD40 repeat protein